MALAIYFSGTAAGNPLLGESPPANLGTRPRLRTGHWPSPLKGLVWNLLETGGLGR
jgi:hypothetical protein